jgi:hypothetical protein
MAKLHRKCKSGAKWHEDNHLCRIIVRGDLDLITKLVVEPKFICKNYGRAAHKSTNLCRGMKI